jgi:hypothetical protein
MNDSEYPRLFGPHVGTGWYKASDFWEANFAIPVGTDVEENRRRLLLAFETMPVSFRTDFLQRLHDSTVSNAVGAWSELEFAALLQAGGVEFAWIGEQKHSGQPRPLDFMLGQRIHAEVTHLQESGIPDSQRQLSRLIARGIVPAGTYILTSGDGQPPVRKLRAALKRLPSDAPIEAVVGDWSIRQVEERPPSPQVGESMWMAATWILVEKVKHAMQEKRRQARKAGARELVVSMLILDRHTRTLMDLLKANHRLLRGAVKGSGQGASGLIIHGLVLGIVAGDQFPFVPEWVVFATTDDYLLRQLQAEYVRLPEGAQEPQLRTVLRAST